MNNDRTQPPVGKTTIRQQFIKEVFAILSEATFNDDDPAGEPLFDIVKKGNIEDLSRNETPCVAVEEGTEALQEGLYAHNDKRLRLYLHFKVVRAEGIDADDVITYYFARLVQLFVTTNSRLSNLIMDMAEAGNSIQTNGSTDPEPGGTIYFDVDYRHERGDWFNR